MDPEVLKKAGVPILIKDSGWKKMTAGFQNRRMKRLVGEMEAILREQTYLKKEARQLAQAKREMTGEILAASHAMNEKTDDGTAESQMMEKRSRLLQISADLETAYEKLDRIPVMLDEMNFLLLEETTQQVCQQLADADKQNRRLDEQIRHLRSQLNEKRKEKEQIEEKLTTWYGFIHHLVGPREMEKLDQQIRFSPQMDIDRRDPDD